MKLRHSRISVQKSRKRCAFFVVGTPAQTVARFLGARKGRKGRGVTDKVTAVGLLKHHGKVYSQTTPGSRGDTLTPIIRSTIKPDSVRYSDTSKGSFQSLHV